MPVRARDIPTILVERIEAAHPAPASFGADETDDWPAKVLPTLLRQGVVAEDDRVDSVIIPLGDGLTLIRKR